MNVRLEGSAIDVIEVPQNAIEPMDVRLDGSAADVSVSKEQPRKAP